MINFLSIENLTIDYLQHGRWVSAVRDVSLTLQPGQTLGIVGESGCGKSTLALALMGLLPQRESQIPSGKIIFKGDDLLGLDKEGWQHIRGKRIAMVFQDPFSALNPVLSINYQLEEVIKLDKGVNDHQRAIDLLHQVQLPDPERILASYPHQISGGQRQRVLLACMLARNPEILIADEPTTALDVTVQDEIVKLLINLQREFRMAMIFVTHNLGLVKELSHILAVMYAGQIVESGNTHSLLKDPQHPYTQGLLRSMPTLKKSKGPLPMLEGQPPEPAALPSGCPFHLRCEKKFGPCAIEDPSPRKVGEKLVRCHLYPV